MLEVRDGFCRPAIRLFGAPALIVDPPEREHPGGGLRACYGLVEQPAGGAGPPSGQQKHAERIVGVLQFGKAVQPPQAERFQQGRFRAVQFAAVDEDTTQLVPRPGHGGSVTLIVGFAYGSAEEHDCFSEVAPPGVQDRAMDQQQRAVLRRAVSL